MVANYSLRDAIADTAAFSLSSFAALAEPWSTAATWERLEPGSTKILVLGVMPHAERGAAGSRMVLPVTMSFRGRPLLSPVCRKQLSTCTRTAGFRQNTIVLEDFHTSQRCKNERTDAACDCTLKIPDRAA